MNFMMRKSFQRRVGDWINACFGEADDTENRNHRFLEEALELVQACGCTEIEARQLVRYVYGRPTGDLEQEVGGVMTTLAALCNTQDVNMMDCGEMELVRVWTKIEKIRAKQAAKPKFSPLPGYADECASPYEIAKKIIGASENKSIQVCVLDPLILLIAEAIEAAEIRGANKIKEAA